VRPQDFKHKETNLLKWTMGFNSHIKTLVWVHKTQRDIVPELIEFKDLANFNQAAKPVSVRTQTDFRIL